MAAASAADVAVVFLGLPARLESEGYDRDDIDLPADQLELLDAVVAANPKTVVVLSNGRVVALPFADRVPAILEAWLLGQAGGGATADVLFGDVNPSGKLTETIPLRLEDTPAFLNFPGKEGTCATARASSSATAGMTRGAWTWHSRSGTACRTRRSHTAMPGHGRCGGDLEVRVDGDEHRRPRRP